MFSDPTPLESSLADTPTQMPAGVPQADQAARLEAIDPAEKKAVKDWATRIKQARDVRWKDPFKRMREDTQWATYGADKAWVSSRKYRTNLIGKHIRRTVADLYARNPKVVAKRRNILDFAVWDGTAASLQAAMQAVQQPSVPDGMGMMQPDPNALAVLQDAQQGMQERRAFDRLAQTITTVVQHSWDLPFKINLKAALRRSRTCGVAYIRYDLYRQSGTEPDVLEHVFDTRTKMANLAAAVADQQEDAAEGYGGDDADADALELQQAQASLQGEEEYTTEGILYTFPKPTQVIWSPETRDLRTTLGAAWGAEERYLTPTEVQAAWQVDICGSYTAFRRPGEDKTGSTYESCKCDDDGAVACTWEIYDRRSGNRFVIADGYPGYVVAPANPLVFRKRFFPWLPIVSNESELPDGELFPLSDVQQLIEIQDEHNQAKQGLREHRKANRPIYLAPTGMFEEGELHKITNFDAFDIIPIAGLQPGTKSEDVLVPVKKIEIDPSLYSVKEIFLDFQLVSGDDQAQLGATSGSTATEAGLASNSRKTELSADSDSLDDILSELASEVAIMAADGLSEQTVMDIAGKGAVWPQLDRKAMIEELEVKIKAGSSGRPNQQLDLQNAERLAPFIERAPGLNPMWWLGKLIEIMDADIDLTDALAGSMPSITSINTAMAKSLVLGGQPQEQGPGAGVGMQAPAQPGGEVNGAATAQQPLQPALSPLDPNEGPKASLNSLQGGIRGGQKIIDNATPVLGV